MLIHPDEEQKMLEIEQFIDTSRYGSREPILNGEIGKVVGIKVLMTTQIPSGTVLYLDPKHAAWAAFKRDLQLKRYDNARKDSIELWFYFEVGVEVVNENAICLSLGHGTKAA
jgi:hypothetical protein